jgi:hypothetical protein
LTVPCRQNESQGKVGFWFPQAAKSDRSAGQVLSQHDRRPHAGPEGAVQLVKTVSVTGSSTAVEADPPRGPRRQPEYRLQRGRLAGPTTVGDMVVDYLTGGDG